MSAGQKLIVPFAAILLVGITLAAGLLLVDEEGRDIAFWVAIGPVLLGECILGLSLAGIGRNRLLLFCSGSSPAATTYLIFTLIMLFVFHRGASATTLIITQSIGLGVWLIFQFLSWLADHDGRVGSVFATTGYNKIGFSQGASALLTELKSRCPEEKELIRESGRLAEAARFAAESVKGSAQIDAMICTKIQTLRMGKNTLTPEEMLAEVKEARELFRRRETLIRELD